MKTIAKRSGAAVLILAFLIAVGALYAYIYIIPSITGALTPTAIAEYGEMRTSNEARAIVIRDESLVYSQQTGNAVYYAPECEKTRKSQKVADTYPVGGTGQGYWLTKTAVISYYSDGLEERLSSDTLGDVTPELFKELFEGEQGPVEPASIKTDTKEEGDPLYKTITGDTWYVALEVPGQYAENYEMGKTVSLRFEDGTEIPFTICRITQYEENWIIVVQTKRYYEKYAMIRTCNLTVVTKDNSGLVVPTSSIAFKEMEDGRVVEGVYIKNINGNYNFYRVKIVAEDREAATTLIVPSSFSEKDEEGNVNKISTVSIYDEILKDASGLSDVVISEEIPEEEEEEEIVFEWEKKAQEEENKVQDGASGDTQSDAQEDPQKDGQ